MITVDNAVTTDSDGFIGTDNLKAGEAGGRRLCELLKKAGRTQGEVLLESSVAGVQVLKDRDNGFKQGLAATCPDVEVATTRYNNNDINTAAGQVNDAITSNRDLLGVFADNNVSGVGAARAIKDNDAADRIPVVAFDSDPQENAALADGTIDALVVQNPYFFGYQGVLEAAMATAGNFPPVKLDPGAVVVDKSNMGKPDVERLLKPPTEKLCHGARGAARRLEGLRRGPGHRGRRPRPATPARCCCLAGENGAGKSTVIKVLTGAIRRDAGSYRIDGAELGDPGPAEARAAGVGVVYQELSLLPELTVQDNLLMGRLPSRHGLVRSGALRERARELLDRVGLRARRPRRAGRRPRARHPPADRGGEGARGRGAA